jgi:radical SAM-linked protein
MTSAFPKPEPAVPPSSGPRACDKVRIRFRKSGSIRLVSHRDLMKCCERMLRRSALPFVRTQGFHPMPRMVLAQALGLGIAGLNEVLELEFSEVIEPEVVRERLAPQMPPGMEILAVSRIPVKTTGQPRRAGYRMAVPTDHEAVARAGVDAVLAAEHCWVERMRPAPRRFDLRPLISELHLRLAPAKNQDSPVLYLEMLLWVTPQGSARPDEVLSALGLADLVAAGTLLERHVLELWDETTDPGPLPDVLRAATDRPRPVGEPAPGPTALISGPMNFDS